MTAGGNDLEPDAASVATARKGKLVELEGSGRARLSKDYGWQPVTFGCRWPRDAVVELERFGDFVAAGRATEVKGEGWSKSDARHSQSTPITFRCVSDPDRGGVATATFEPKESSRTPTGEIASGRTGTLVCEAYGKAQKICAAGIRGNVRVVRQLGPVPCEAYRNWIYSLSGITVWGGCAAEFELDVK